MSENVKLPREIEDWFFKVALYGDIEYQLVARFYKAHGSKATLTILRTIHRTRAYQIKNDFWIDAAIDLWEKYSTEYKEGATKCQKT